MLQARIAKLTDLKFRPTRVRRTALYASIVEKLRAVPADSAIVIAENEVGKSFPSRIKAYAAKVGRSVQVRRTQEGYYAVLGFAEPEAPRERSERAKR